MKSIFKNYVFLTTFLMGFSFSSFASTDSNVVYVFEIKDEIANPVWHNTQKAFEEAALVNADYIVIDMNTYGGLVLIADSIRTIILRSKIPVYILINNNAASAGALISIACDKIYMMPGSTIGAATVVTEDGKAAIDKYQSYMRSKMRATAEESGRDPEIAEAMVDQDIAIEGIIEEGKLLTFTVSEALKNNYCEKEVANLEELLEDNNLENAEVIHFKPSIIDKIIGLLTTPAVSGVLIMIMLGGIYFELQSPGIGFPIAASIIGAILFFAPLYIEGMADNWEIILFMVGLILLAAEVFVIPGTGITGVLGIVFIITSLTLSMVQNVNFDFQFVNPDRLLLSFSVVLFSMFVMIVLTFVILPKILASGRIKNLILDSSQQVSEGYVAVNTDIFQLVGKQGVVHSDLRPAGKVTINTTHFDATSIESYIAKGSKIEVVSTEGPQLNVRKI